MKKRNFDQFTDYIKSNITKYLHESYADAVIETVEVPKVNRTLTGLRIFRPEDKVAPTIYLEDFYSEYMEGKRIDHVCRAVANLYKEAACNRVAISLEEKIKKGLENFPFNDFEKVKDRITIRLVGTKFNTDMILTRPHTTFHDLSVFYQVEVFADETGKTSAPITYNELEAWGVTTEQLHNLALENTKRMFPVKFCSMNEILFGESYEDMEKQELFLNQIFMF